MFYYTYTHTQHLWTCVQCFEGICMLWKLLCSSASATAAIHWLSEESWQVLDKYWQQIYKRNFLCNLMLDFTWCCGKSWAAKKKHLLQCRITLKMPWFLSRIKSIQHCNYWGITTIESIKLEHCFNLFSTFYRHFRMQPLCIKNEWCKTHVFICLSKQIISNNENYT